AGNVLQTWSAPISSQTGAAEVETRLAVDPQSNILALGGTLAPAVFQFSPTGKFITRLMTSGQGPGQLDRPRAISLDSQGRIYISDSNGIQVYAPNSRYLATIPTIHATTDIAAGPGDALWVLNANEITQFILR
ncbi:MAG: hypothetical protein WCF84_11720, partial [Anaerolineae bacterium]